MPGRELPVRAASTETCKHKPALLSHKGWGATCPAGELWVRRRPACRVSDGPLPLVSPGRTL